MNRKLHLVNLSNMLMNTLLPDHEHPACTSVGRLFMSNQTKARDNFESWLAVQFRDNPTCDLTYQTLVWLERVYIAGLGLKKEIDHRDLWEDPQKFFEDMLKRDGQLGYIM